MLLSLMYDDRAEVGWVEEKISIGPNLKFPLAIYFLILELSNLHNFVEKNQ